MIDNANGTLNCLSDTRTAGYLASVHYRGQSSLHFAKHSLSVDLVKPAKWLGFPEDTSFVLHGPSIDGSLIRNHLAHWLFRGTQRYSPRTRHIVVFIRNGLDPSDATPQYHGIYLAMEKISYGPNRVGLAHLNASCSGEEELSGGWAWQNNPLSYGLNSPNIVVDKYEMLFGPGERPILMYPPADDMTQTMRDFFVNPETGPLPKLYRYLYDNMTTPDHLEKHLDLGSFTDYLLHTELSQNSDAYRRSAFYFKDRGQPINAGPVWDFNLAYGRGANQKDWLFKPRSFWKRLMCNYKMAALVPQRWRQLRKDVWSDDSIRGFINDAAAPIARQLTRCADWRTRNLQCAYVKANGAFQSHVDSLMESVLDRAFWMDQNVGTFYKTLDHLVCDVGGDLPQYNCAADGKDSRCLSTPSLYIDSVEFPPIRKPNSAKQCAPRSTDAAIEVPTVDHCWLSAGVYITEGSLTPFCSGYGSCPPGPGAKCKCSPGHNEPTCARSDDPIAEPGHFAIDADLAPVVTVLQRSNDTNMTSGYAFLVVCAMFYVVFVVRRFRQRRGYRTITGGRDVDEQPRDQSGQSRETPSYRI